MAKENNQLTLFEPTEIVSTAPVREVPDIASRGSVQIIERSHGESMTMADFGTWLEANMGSGNLRDLLQIGAFLACVDVISQDVSKAELELHERSEDGLTSRVVRPKEHPFARMLALDPNRRHTWIEFVEMVVAWRCITSNAYIYIVRNRFGEPVELVPLQSGQVVDQVVPNTREIFYDVTATTEQQAALLGFQWKQVPERDIIHVRGRMLDGMDGYSTLAVGDRAFKIAKDMDKFRKNLFGNEGQLRGVFSREQPGALQDEAWRRLREQYKIMMNRFRDLTEPIVLEGGIKFQSIASNPRDMEFVKQFEASVNEVCRICRVPPHKIFHTTDTKYDNLETSEKLYVNDCLIPVCKHFEYHYDRALLSKEDRLRYFFQHNRADMIIKDTKTETERWYRSLTTGGCTFDEYRAALGLNPLEGGVGNGRLIPANMVVIGPNNEIVVQATAAGGKDDEEKSGDEEESSSSTKKLRLISSR